MNRPALLDFDTALETARDEGRIAPMSLGDECPAEPLRYIT